MSDIERLTDQDWSEVERLRKEAFHDGYYREWLAGRSVDLDPVLIALGNFNKAAQELNKQWEEAAEDLTSSHPIDTCEADPFDIEYGELAELIATWHDKACERARQAMIAKPAETIVVTQVSHFRRVPANKE